MGKKGVLISISASYSGLINRNGEVLLRFKGMEHLSEWHIRKDEVTMNDLI